MTKPNCSIYTTNRVSKKTIVIKRMKFDNRIMDAFCISCYLFAWIVICWSHDKEYRM